jgi:hypothetical protein
VRWNEDAQPTEAANEAWCAVDCSRLTNVHDILRGDGAKTKRRVPSGLIRPELKEFVLSTPAV